MSSAPETSGTDLGSCKTARGGIGSYPRPPASRRTAVPLPVDSPRSAARHPVPVRTASSTARGVSLAASRVQPSPPPGVSCAPRHVWRIVGQTLHDKLLLELLPCGASGLLDLHERVRGTFYLDGELMDKVTGKVNA